MPAQQLRVLHRGACCNKSAPSTAMAELAHVMHTHALACAVAIARTGLLCVSGVAQRPSHRSEAQSRSEVRSRAASHILARTSRPANRAEQIYTRRSMHNRPRMQQTARAACIRQQASVPGGAAPAEADIRGCCTPHTISMSLMRRQRVRRNRECARPRPRPTRVHTHSRFCRVRRGSAQLKPLDMGAPALESPLDTLQCVPLHGNGACARGTCPRQGRAVARASCIAIQ